MPSTPAIRHRRGPTQGTRGHAALVVAIIAAMVPARSARATSITVPDDVAAVQAAMDAGVDTVLIRAGVYAETPIMRKRVSLVGISGGSRPVLSGLILWVEGGSNVPVRIAGLEIETRVESASLYASELPTVSFSDCTLKAGFREFSEKCCTERVFQRCRIKGVVDQGGVGALRVDSCDVEGWVVAGHWDCLLSVTRSRFRSVGAGAGVSTRGAIHSANIHGNVIEGGNIGISVLSSAVLEDNHIERGRIDVVAGDGAVRLSRNRVENTPAGLSILVTGHENLALDGNVVLNGRGGGIYVFARTSATITRNLVSRCQGDGFNILADADHEVLEVSNNTSVFNRDHGFRSDCPFGPVAFTGNIGVGNGQHGAWWDNPEVTDFVASRFNNWFDNATGGARGLPSSHDLAVDPLFCDPANGDLQLSAASPLADVAGYGRLGALGIGCFAPGVLQDAFKLTRVGPNPSRGPVAIEFQMPRAASIEIDVFDLQGRLVASPVRANWPAGKHSVSWKGADMRPGLYLLRYRFPGGEDRRRLIRTP